MYLQVATAAIQILEKQESNFPEAKERANKMISDSKSFLKQMQEDLSKSAMMEVTFLNRDLLLGTLKGKRATHIMVTIDKEAAQDTTRIHDLIIAGTTVFRINCAHGDPAIWSEIIRMVKTSSEDLKKPCRILMDLAGPKLRTGKLKAGPCVLKISPKKNVFGNVIYPAQVWLSAKGIVPPTHVSSDAVLHVDGQEFLSSLAVDDVVKFIDTRGKRMHLKILEKFRVFSGTGFIAKCMKTTYIESGTKLQTKDGSSVAFVVDVPPLEPSIRLNVGDLLIISRDSSNKDDESCCAVGSHRITCSSGYLFDSVKPGDSIAFDDGKIFGVVKGNGTEEVVVSITHAGPKGTRLGSEKSINVPGSDANFESNFKGSHGSGLHC